MTNKPAIQTGSQFLVYQAEDGKLKIDVRFEGEMVWLAQQQMAELFQTTKQNISLHIQNIYEEQELKRVSTVKDSLTVQQEGNRSVRRRLQDQQGSETVKDLAFSKLTSNFLTCKSIWP